MADDEEIEVPAVGAPWSDVARFALTYNAYERHRGFERVSKLAEKVASAYNADGSLPKRVPDLRCALFFEQRSWSKLGTQQPSGQDRAYVDALLGALHERTGGTVPGPPDPPYDRGPQVHRHGPTREWWMRKRAKAAARRTRR